MIVQGVGAMANADPAAAKKTNNMANEFGAYLNGALEKHKEQLKKLAESITPEMLSEMETELKAKKEAAAAQPGVIYPDAAKYFSHMGEDFNLMFLRSLYESYNRLQERSAPEKLIA